MDARRKNIQLLISQEAISKRVAEMARLLEADYQGVELIVVGLLKGAYPFLADLTRAMDMDIKIDFMKVSSYGSGLESSGNVQIVQGLNSDVKGKHVLIVEDIVDTGQTVAAVIECLRGMAPASVRTCTLLDKPRRRKVEVPVE
jgi:hypoxanthine phosphoribosyltransferase